MADLNVDAIGLVGMDNDVLLVIGCEEDADDSADNIMEVGPGLPLFG